MPMAVRRFELAWKLGLGHSFLQACDTIRVAKAIYPELAIAKI